MEMTTLEFSNTQRVIQQPRRAARVYLATSKLEEERTTIPRPTQDCDAAHVNKTDDNNDCITTDGV